MAPGVRFHLLEFSKYRFLLMSSLWVAVIIKNDLKYWFLYCFKNLMALKFTLVILPDLGGVLIELVRHQDEHSYPGGSPPPPASLAALELHIPAADDRFPESLPKRPSKSG